MITLKIAPQGLRLKLAKGTNLKDLLDENGLLLSYPCGGRGVCGKCPVIFSSGAPAPSEQEQQILSQEELSRGVRLACLCRLNTNATVTIPQESMVAPSRTLYVESIEVPVALDPAVKKVLLSSVSPASLKNQLPDSQRLIRALRAKRIKAHNLSHSALVKLPAVLRSGEDKITVTTLGVEIIDVQAGDTTENIWGLAVDLGTTNIVGMLVNLANGKEAGRITLPNPQLAYGADVISRIEVVSRQPEKLTALQRLAVNSINHIISQLCQMKGIDCQNVYYLTVAGNTAMLHLLLGITPRHLALAPYVPAFAGALELKAAEMGLAMNPEARAYIFPIIGGFVGGDVVDDALVANIEAASQPQILIDIGTNGEVVITNGEKVVATSAAAGPAFEGSEISQGMRAVPGAISNVILNNDIKIETVADEPAVGICGSGLVAAVAELLRCGVINGSGLIHPVEMIKSEERRSLFKPRLETTDNGRRVRIADAKQNARRPIYITQNDIRQFQLAKGAIAAAIKILSKTLKLKAGDIDQVFIAGAFGRYINKEYARRTGLIPKIPLTRINLMGNASLAGAKMVLLNKAYRTKAEKLSEKVKFVELAGRADFQDTFAKALNFPQ